MPRLLGATHFSSGTETLEKNQGNVNSPVLHGSPTRRPRRLGLTRMVTNTDAKEAESLQNPRVLTRGNKKGAPLPTSILSSLAEGGNGQHDRARWQG